jgi:hypothetical protein
MQWTNSGALEFWQNDVGTVSANVFDRHRSLETPPGLARLLPRCTLHNKSTATARDKMSLSRVLPDARPIFDVDCR